MNKKAKEVVLKILLLLVLFIILIFILYQIESLLFSIISTVFFSINIIPFSIMIILHYFLIRFIVTKSIFAGSLFIVKRVVKFKMGSVYADSFVLSLNSLIRSLEPFIQNKREFKTTDLQYLSNSILHILEKINSYIDVVNKMEKIYTISKYKKLLVTKAGELKDSIEEGSLGQFLDDQIHKSSLNFDNIPVIESNQFNFLKIQTNAKILVEIINEFLLKNTSSGYKSLIMNAIFNDSFGTNEQMKIEIKNIYKTEEFKIKTKDNCLIDAILIKSTSCDTTNSTFIESDCKPQKVNRNLIIICSPNGNSFETLILGTKWVDQYLNHNISICLWNYRGYGESTGRPTLQNAKSDAEEIYNFLKKNYYWENIGVHGISIGGIAACHLASKYEDITLCFADRTFCNLEEVIQNFMYGKFLSFLYRLLLIGDSDNVNNFYESKCFKILACDPKDDIIKFSSSLKVGIGKKLVQILKNNLPEKHEHFVRNFLLPDEANSLFKNILFLIENLTKSKLQKNSELEINFQGNMNYKKLSEEGPSTINNDEIKDGFSKALIDILKNEINDFEFSGENLLMINDNNVVDKVKFIDNFFLNCFTWGAINRSDYLNSDRLSIMSKTSVKINKLILNLSKSVESGLISQEDDKIILENVKNLLPILKKFEKYFNRNAFSGFDGNHSDPENHLTLSEEFLKFDMNLICLNCGHNGTYSFKEQEIYFGLLSKSKFKLL